MNTSFIIGFSIYVILLNAVLINIIIEIFKYFKLKDIDYFYIKSMFFMAILLIAHDFFILSMF